MNIGKPDAIIDEVVNGVKTWTKHAKKAEVDAKQVAAIGKLHLVRI